MKKKTQNLKHYCSQFFARHIYFKRFCEYAFTLICSLLSAALFAISIKAFLAPNNSEIVTVVSGGISGISQIVSLIVKMVNPNADASSLNITYSLCYLVLNLPLAYIAFRFIGVRFAIFTIINIIAVSILTSFVNLSFIDELANYVACVIKVDGKTFQVGLLTRTLFAGICTGLSSALAYKVDTSAGGVDILGYYFALKKSTSVGKYNAVLNCVILITFSVLNFCNKTMTTGYDATILAESIAILIFAIIYQFVIMLIIDAINIRNKKVELEIITKEEKLADLLLSNVPHGATIIRGQGAYSQEERLVIKMVISSFEVKKVVEIIKDADPYSFVNVVNLQQVYGRFFIKPVR